VVRVYLPVLVDVLKVLRTERVRLEPRLDFTVEVNLSPQRLEPRRTVSYVAPGEDDGIKDGVVGSRDSVKETLDGVVRLLLAKGLQVGLEGRPAIFARAEAFDELGGLSELPPRC
jgi:hypothetical protein